MVFCKDKINRRVLRILNHRRNFGRFKDDFQDSKSESLIQSMGARVVGGDFEGYESYADFSESGQAFLDD